MTRSAATTDIAEVVACCELDTTLQVAKFSPSQRHRFVEMIQDAVGEPIPMREIYLTVSQSSAALRGSHRADALAALAQRLGTTLQEVVSLGHVAAALHVDQLTARKFVARIQAQSRLRMSYRQVDIALRSLPANQRAEEYVLAAAQRIVKEERLTALLSPLDLHTVLATLEGDLGHTVTGDDVLRIAKYLQPHGAQLSIAELASGLQLEWWCEQIPFAPDMQELVQVVRTVTPALSLKDAATLLTRSPELQSWDDALVRLRSAQRASPSPALGEHPFDPTNSTRVATLLRMSDSEARAFLDTAWPGSAAELELVLERLPDEDRLPAVLHIYCGLREMLQHTKASITDPLTLRAQVAAALGHSPTLEALAVAWPLVDRTYPIVDEVTYYLRWQAQGLDLHTLRTHLQTAYRCSYSYSTLSRYLAYLAHPQEVTAADLWVLVQSIPVGAFPWLMPRPGTSWIRQAQVEHTLSPRLPDDDRTRQRLERYARACWSDIRTNRRYQVPSQGRAEIRVSGRLKTLTSLFSLRFLQEGSEAPAVAIRVQLAEPGLVGTLHIDERGGVTGFHQLSSNPTYAALVACIALGTYRDLVVPTEQYVVPSTPRMPTTGPIAQQITNRVARRGNRQRSLPRVIRSSATTEPVSLDAWYGAQFRALHMVTGHPRWVGPDFLADTDRHHEAVQAGVTLRPGYTWVVEHQRGGDESGMLQVREGDLTNHIIFSPPRSTQEIERLLVSQ